MNKYIIGTNNKFYYYYCDNNAGDSKQLLVDLTKFPQNAMIFSSKEEAEEKIKYICDKNNNSKFWNIHSDYSFETHEECITIKPGDFITGEGDRKFEISDFTVFIIEYVVREA